MHSNDITSLVTTWSLENVTPAQLQIKMQTQQNNFNPNHGVRGWLAKTSAYAKM